MTAFLGISIWITLAMVVPGLVTLAVIHGAVLAASACGSPIDLPDVASQSDWLSAGVAVTVMIMTQALGILLEKVLVDHRWLGDAERTVHIPPGIDPLGLETFTLKPYEEYDGLYLLLAELREDEDTHGHLQRALAQFFLSNNTIVSFAAGIAAAVWLWATVPACAEHHLAGYIGLLAVCLVVTVWVARIRFGVMAKALWAARRRRLAPPQPDMDWPDTSGTR